MTSETTLDLSFVRRRVCDLLDICRSEGTFVGGRNDRVTVLDTAQTPRTTKRCILGPFSTSVSTSKKHVHNKRDTCKGYKCEHCIDYALVKDTYRFLRLWESPSHIYRRVIPSTEWTGRIARQLKSSLPLYLGVYGAHGEHTLLSPEPFEGAERVEAIPALVSAFLAAPNAGKRFSLSRSEVRQERDQVLKDEREERRDKTEYHTRVSRDHSLASLRAAYTDALNRTPEEWIREFARRGMPFSAADLLRNLTDEEVEAALGVFAALRDERAEELEDWNLSRVLLARLGHVEFSDAFSERYGLAV